MSTPPPLFTTEGASIRGPRRRRDWVRKFLDELGTNFQDEANYYDLTGAGVFLPFLTSFELVMGHLIYEREIPLGRLAKDLGLDYQEIFNIRERILYHLKKLDAADSKQRIKLWEIRRRIIL